MKRKLVKHLSIILKRIGYKKESKRLKSIGNKHLDQVFNSIFNAKSEEFTAEDKSKFKLCEDFRKRLLNSDQEVTYEVFGSDKKSTVQTVCKKAASSPNWCHLIYNIVKDADAKSVFEVGTNLGVSGTYILQALSSPNKKSFHTLEGLPIFCKIAGDEFEQHKGNTEVTVHEGLYDKTFDNALNSVSEVDCAFIDGNHQYEPTLEYFQKLKTKTSPFSLLLFDDINWSDGMKKAWDKIKADKSISFSIDLYEIGIVIIDKNYNGPSEHFNFHYSY